MPPVCHRTMRLACMPLLSCSGSGQNSSQVPDDSATVLWVTWPGPSCPRSMSLSSLSSISWCGSWARVLSNWTRTSPEATAVCDSVKAYSVEPTETECADGAGVGGPEAGVGVAVGDAGAGAGSPDGAAPGARNPGAAVHRA